MHPGAPSGPPESPSARAFVVAVFAIGVVLTAIVGYFGFTGTLGAGILGTQHSSPPGSAALTSCQGHAALGSFHFVIVAGPKGTFTFNGSSPGPCLAVATGSTVLVVFQVSSDARASDSWVLIPGSGAANQAPVFPGAGWSNDSRFSGLAPGHSQNFTFRATTPGAYRYVSEVGDHAAVGEWGGFNVTASALSVAPTSITVNLPTIGASFGLLALIARRPSGARTR